MTPSPNARGALLLNYAGFNGDEIRAGVRALGDVLRLEETVSRSPSP
jgi:DNA-binding transcriptional MocR family regulator